MLVCAVWGASALDLAYIAAGRCDGYWDRGIKPWDIAAGMILVREAGGMIDALSIDSDPMISGDIIAAPADHFEQFADLVRSA